MIGIRVLTYTGLTARGPVFKAYGLTKDYFLLPDIKFTGKLVKNNQYVGIITKNRPAYGYVLVGVNDMLLPDYVKLILDKKIIMDKRLLEYYKKVFINDKRVDGYIYKKSGIRNKILIDDEVLIKYISMYILDMHNKIK